MKKKTNLLLLGMILIIYLMILFLFKRQIFTYKFNKKLIDRYFCSQDIPYEPNCRRVWLSDEELHIAAGYLYAKGSDPAVIDFQHPPLIAYLYGFSILFFNNPYYLEIFFGLLFLSLIYLLGLKIFKSKLVSTIGCLLLLIDPLFIDLSSQASYELGQAVFLLMYLILMVFYKKNFVLPGIALGLLCASKFWGAAVFFVGITALYKIINKEFNLKIFFYHLLIAFFTFSLTYLKSFLNQKFLFNIVFFQLKILKYWIQHSITNIPFASLVLFTTGFFKSWWGNYEILRSHVWSIIWPISLISSFYVGIKNLIKNKTLTKIVFFSIIPLLYLIYLGVQAPFPRYFILILPFCYLSFAYSLSLKIKSKKIKPVFKNIIYFIEGIK
ncbi:MAG: hypothetical protein QHH09_01345 [Microgenomates group bacterium]|nr:hypothetical protein [Microgenomates group bacterium]